MKHWVSTLLIVLVIQCGITAAVFWPEPTSLSSDTPQPIAPFPASAIDELRIGDRFDNEAVLIRSGNQWLLPDLENLPASAEKIDALLQNLTTQSGNWPVADSSAARQRFQVAKYHYQKRLTVLSGGQELSNIFFGTSPGFRKLHARNDKQDAIYSISFSASDIPAVTDAWLETRLLQVRAPLRIDTDLYNLYLENGRWMSATGGQPDKEEIKALLAALRNLQVDGIADADLQRDLSVTEADLELNIQSLAGEVTLKLVTLDGEHFIHSSEFPLFFTSSAYDFDSLTGIDARRVSGEDRIQ